MEKPVRSLLVSEYFPNRPEQLVHGVFQRLRCHVAALSSIGPVDFAFLWPLHWGERDADKLAALDAFCRHWLIAGRVVLIAPPPLPARVRWRRRGIGLSDLIAAGRGAVSFSDYRPNLRSSRRAEVVRLDAIIDAWQPDLIFAHRLAATAPLLRAKRPLPSVLVDFDDLEHVVINRRAMTTLQWRERAGLTLSAALARRTERIVARWATASLVCSAHDQAVLQRLVPSAHIRVAPNTASAEGPLPLAATSSILFVGYCRYQPNAEGVAWFVNEVLPLVRAVIPAARFIIAGDGGRELAVAGRDRQIDALGFVPDLTPLYAAARVVICPVQRGGGTRIKIVEAAMLGRPIVSTTVGAEGLDFVDGEAILLADKAADFAAAIVTLVRDDGRAAALGTAAAAAASRHYGQEKIRSDLARLAASVARMGRAARDDAG